MNVKVNEKIAFNEIIVLPQKGIREFDTYKYIKRGTDIFISIIALILLSPMFLIIGVLIKMESKGPAFFVYKIIEKNGNTVGIYKFRTMVQNAEELINKFTPEQMRQFKLADDPRITKIGKILRKTNLDELPQLINIIKGDLSLIGSKSTIKEEIEKYENKFLSITPSFNEYIEISAYDELKVDDIGYNMNLIESDVIGTSSDNLSTVLPNFEQLGNFIHKKERNFYFSVKRIFDLLCAIIGCCALVPVALITKICYLATGDKKSIFYKQKRIGKDGKYIYIYKFRSMVYNADEVLKELLKQPKYKKEWKENQKFAQDPRITKIGNILRKTSLDELPQFINVLKGDMSLIGPRPLVEGELDSHLGNHSVYEMVQPGISGWWAANGRSATTYEKRLELEYYYCKNCNIIIDIKCIIKTIAAVILKTGAK